MVLSEMEKYSLARHPTLKKNDDRMRDDLNIFCEYHKAKCHKTNDCIIFKRVVEDLIQRGLLKNMVV